jgi:hypothetical protein
VIAEEDGDWLVAVGKKVEDFEVTGFCVVLLSVQA